MIMHSITMPVLVVLLGTVSFFLIRFVTTADTQGVTISNHEVRITRMENVAETLSKLADKYDLRFDRMDEKIERKHGSRD